MLDLDSNFWGGNFIELINKDLILIRKIGRFLDLKKTQQIRSRSVDLEKSFQDRKTNLFFGRSYG